MKQQGQSRQGTRRQAPDGRCERIRILPLDSPTTSPARRGSRRPDPWPPKAQDGRSPGTDLANHWAPRALEASPVRWGTGTTEFAGSCGSRPRAATRPVAWLPPWDSYGCSRIADIPVSCWRTGTRARSRRGAWHSSTRTARCAATVLVDRSSEHFPGAGEATGGPAGVAIANAVFDATSVRARRLPLTPQALREAAA